MTPVPGSVLPYTINDNNAGSIAGGTGVNASGVVLTETVPANTIADLSNSTPGWTLTSGTGGPGSTYTFAVGALSAGDTGSAVFSVDVNSTFPAGTSSLTDTVTITDAASDSSSGTRVTPLGTPVATRLVFAQPPGNGESGVALTPAVAVAVQDQFGNTFTVDSSSTVTLTLNGGTFAGGGNTATSTVSNGVATFANLVINTTGSDTLTATDGSLAGVTSGSFAIQAASKLAITQQPTNGKTGTALTPAVAVAVEDASGATVLGDSSAVTLTLNGGTFAGGSSTVTANAVHGVATFGNLVINAAGTYTLAASDGTLTGATSGSFTVVGQTVTTVDDAVQGTGANQFHYVGTWSHVTGTNIPNSYDGTVSYTDTANDYATISFTGTQIKLDIAERNNRGIGAVSIDGGPESNVDEYAAQDAGDVLAFTSAVLAPGTHTLKLRNTGTKDAASTGTRVDVDRVDLLS